MSERSTTLELVAPETVHAAKCELAEATLRSFGSLRLQVTGFSMLPSLWPGDQLLIHRQQIQQVRRGEIVLFARDGKLVVHRALWRRGDHETSQLITKGDSLLDQDSTVTADEFLGKVAFVLCDGEWIEPSTRLRFGARLTAALLSRSELAAKAVVSLRAKRQRFGRKPEALCEK